MQAAALEAHRGGESPFLVVQRISSAIDSMLRQLFSEFLGDQDEHVCLLAVGGYGRQELCPQSDIDILFVREEGCAADEIERLVRLLWDSGFQLGHAVRTPEECYEFMKEDFTTANTMLESRFLIGSERLHGRFLSRAVNRYRRRWGDAFTKTKFELLRKSIEDPNRTIYVLEPHLKEGVCGLRDIQRVLWIENMKHRGGTFDALLKQGRFSPDEVLCLKEAYSFYLRVRCELHLTHRVRQDILERDSVMLIAANLGYGENGEGHEAVERLMGDYYRHARNVYRFLRYYLQTGTRGRSLWERLSRRLLSKEVKPHLSLYKGRLYLTGEPPDAATPERILELFEVALEKNARLSAILSEWVRRTIAKIDADFAHSTDILHSFRAILRAGKSTGRILKTMHATGVLARILPEFEKLNCLVNFDGHHQFTVDEHTLKTLEELDRIETEPAYPEAEFRKIFFEIKDHLPLRLALLLHDIGKSIPGKHSVSGTEAATVICERLGLDEKTIETVDFLVYRHLELFRVSERRDFNEANVIDSLAKLVQSEERLKMLYLLTYIDVVSVGPGTWTKWKGAQLAELYQRTLIHLKAGADRGGSLEIALTTAGIAGVKRQKVLDHCRMIGTAGYARETLPERMLYHIDLAEKFLEKGEMQVSLESFVGFHEITICGGDRPGLFADFTGVLFSEGFNLLGARIYSRSDEVVIDVFHVEVADTIQVSVEDRVERIRKKLRRIESNKESVEDFIRQRNKSYRPKRWRKPLFGPSVTFDNDSSEVCTVIEVSAGDRPGLLYELVNAIHRLGLDVRTAKISTLTDRAHDVFYVVDKNGGKITSPERRSAIVQELSMQAREPAADAGPTREVETKT